jgi:uncharacterized protein (TIGR02466 family)
MDKNNINLFPILIKHTKKFIDVNEINEILNLVNNLNLNTHGSFLGEAISSYTLQKNNNFFKDTFLEKKLNLAISEYAMDLGIEDCSIERSWVNIQKPNSELLEHNHSPSPISGALYLQVDDKSSKIFFHNPNPFIKVIRSIKSTYNNTSYFYIKPENGDLILFPGWLEHSSNREINKSQERIVLSFNTI